MSAVRGLRPLYLAFLLTFLAALGPAADASAQGTARAVTKLGNFGLSLGLVNDDVWMFELSVDPPDPGQPFEHTIMISPEVTMRAPAGGGDAWSSETVAVRLNQNPPAIVVSRKDGGRVFTISPYAPDGQLTGLSFSGDYTHLMGLGADYQNFNSTLNLLGTHIRPASPFGNGRINSFGARPNQVQVPVVYAMGQGLQCGALFADETIPLTWSFTGQPWVVSTSGPLGPKRTFRFFVITGPDLPALRTHFLGLTGRPPVPPRKALGVWASGIQGHTENEWRERVGFLRGGVPGLTGLVADGPGDLAGTLETAKAFNLHLMVNESAYVSQESPHYTEMARRSFLVRQTAGGPIMVVPHLSQPSGLLDYTNNAVPSVWHSLFRADQISSGISTFRLTDGDLESASPEAYYQGPPDDAVHSHYAWANSYTMKWQEGLLNAVRNQRLRVRPRLMLLTRTGLAGLPRLSGALYNGEAILYGGRSLLVARSSLALAGFDYYSSDLSHNLASRPPDQNAQLYDTWLAKNALTDIPLVLPEELLLRPGARYNLALRETLGPYYYSLAWEAYLSGQPILAPLAYYFQADPAARERVGELMLGSGLLLGLDFDGAAERAEIYVPQGRWYNWRTGEVIDQAEPGLAPMDLKDAGQLTPPILARGGAIIPAVEEVTLKGGAPEKIAALKIFIGTDASEFTWYEDDGETLGYLNRNFGRTHISAVTRSDGSTVVTIKAREGSWDGAPSERRLLVDIYGPKAPGEATLDSQPHNRVARTVELDQLDSGWASIGTNRIRFKTPPLDTNVDHVLWFK